MDKRVIFTEPEFDAMFSGPPKFTPPFDQTAAYLEQKYKTFAQELMTSLSGREATRAITLLHQSKQAAMTALATMQREKQKKE